MADKLGGEANRLKDEAVEAEFVILLLFSGDNPNYRERVERRMLKVC